MTKLRPITKNETIAITIPTKNRPPYLTALLASLIHQTYANWMLVINDQSDVPVEENHAIQDLFSLIKNKGKDIRVIHSDSGWERHQRAMEEALFQQRIKQIVTVRAPMHKELRRYEISDLEKRVYKSFPLATLKGKILALVEKRFLRFIRRLFLYFSG